MLKPMRVKPPFWLGVILLAGFCVALAPAQEKRPHMVALEKQIAGREKQPAEQVFKNIQVLKGMPAAQLLRVMDRAFVPNLGVDCSHCHVEGDWANDEKAPMRVARGMWTLRAQTQEMVRKITGNEDAVVTCYTCHKGQPKPSFAPGP